MAARRDSKGRYIKGSGGGGGAKRKRAPARTVIRESGPGDLVVVSGSRAPARRGGGGVPAKRASGGGSRALTTRRKSSSAGMLGDLGKWFAPKVEDLIAGAALGWAVGNRRATVDSVLAKAPEFIRPIGGFGIAALGFGALGELVPGLRRYTRPLARQSAGLAAYHLGRRGSLYEANGDIISGLDDDSSTPRGGDTDGDIAGAVDGDEAGVYDDEDEDDARTDYRR